MNPNRATPSNRFRYWFDRTLSRGPLALGVWLALVSFLFVIVVTLALYLIRSNPDLTWSQLFYTILLQALVPNPVDPKSGSWVFLIAMLIITLGGLFMFSIFIGIFATTIDQRVQSLRKGRSMVLENDHTVILGWSSQIFPIISELSIANLNRRHPCVAILADKDQVEMEDEIKSRIGNSHNTRIVCRSGDPLDMHDQKIVSPDTARSIIVLATNFEYHDSEVLKTVLALTNNPDRRQEPFHIVGSLRNPASAEVARLIVQRGETVLFQVDDVISRIIAQTCRQTGLSVVYEELLDFEGDEIYFKEEPSLVGKTYGEVLFRYEDSAVMGIASQQQGVRLNLPPDTPIEPGDQIIAITEDDDTILLSNLADYRIDASAIRSEKPEPIAPENTLVLGWNRRAPLILEYIDQYVMPGSETWLVALGGESAAEVEAIARQSVNQTLDFRNADTTSRQVLESLPIERFDHVIILSYTPFMTIQRADSATMMTLLHLRDIADKKGASPAIVSEIMDIRNRELIRIARVDDFIVSDRLVSLALTQLSENVQVLDVFRDLFNPEGAEIYLKPVEDYIRLGQPVNFYTVLEAARQRGETALGYRLQGESEDADNHYGVHLNPRKSQPIIFSANDRVIVLSEKQ